MRLRNELQSQFRHLVSIRQRSRGLLTELKDHRGEPPPSPMTSWMIAAAAGATAGAAAGAVGNYLLPAANALDIYRLKMNVRLTIDEDRRECQTIKAMEGILGQSVAEFAVFCLQYIDSVLSSNLVEVEFSSLLDILRGRRSHGAAALGELTRPILLDEERVSNLLERLQSSETNEEASTISQAILDELQECPSDEKFQWRIMNFMETKFTEACASQL